MSLDDPRNPAHAEALERGDLPKPRQAVNWVDERDLGIEFWGEAIIKLESDLAHARTQYAQIEAWRPPHQDAEPSDRGRAGIDTKLFDVDGSETRDQWTEPESFPSRMVDVATGDRL